MLTKWPTILVPARVNTRRRVSTFLAHPPKQIFNHASTTHAQTLVHQPQVPALVARIATKPVRITPPHTTLPPPSLTLSWQPWMERESEREEELESRHCSVARNALIYAQTHSALPHWTHTHTHTMSHSCLNTPRIPLLTQLCTR